MSEEGGSINENADLSNGDEVATPREPEAVPELVPDPEVEIISSVREEGGIDEGSNRRSNKRTNRTNRYIYG